MDSDVVVHTLKSDPSIRVTKQSSNHIVFQITNLESSIHLIKKIGRQETEFKSHLINPILFLGHIVLKILTLTPKIHLLCFIR